jgi:hypothetical protein
VIKRWARTHPRGAAIFLNLTMIGCTAVFTLIALGPDSLLDHDCTGTKCLDSHADAAAFAIVTGLLALLILGLTVRAARKGRFKSPQHPELGARDRPAG